MRMWLWMERGAECAQGGWCVSKKSVYLEFGGGAEELSGLRHVHRAGHHEGGLCKKGVGAHFIYDSNQMKG
jgi:hypothetical protein